MMKYTMSKGPDLVEMLQGVCEEVGGDGGAVRLLQVELLQVAALVQAANCRHQHTIVVTKNEKK